MLLYNVKNNANNKVKDGYSIRFCNSNALYPVYDDDGNLTSFASFPDVVVTPVRHIVVKDGELLFVS